MVHLPTLVFYVLRIKSLCLNIHPFLSTVIVNSRPVSVVTSCCLCQHSHSVLLMLSSHHVIVIIVNVDIQSCLYCCHIMLLLSRFTFSLVYVFITPCCQHSHSGLFLLLPVLCRLLSLCAAVVTIDIQSYICCYVLCYCCQC